MLRILRVKKDWWQKQFLQSHHLNNTEDILTKHYTVLSQIQDTTIFSNRQISQIILQTNRVNLTNRNFTSWNFLKLPFQFL